MSYVVAKRPRLITWICIIGFILVVLSMPSVFSPDTRRLGNFFPALFSLLISLRFIAYVGLWYMKRWGVELLLITFVATVIQGVLQKDVSVISIVYHLIILTLLIVRYRKMDRNL